jgi:diguanylate cyclase (GGDEF)-like protein/PAS domain S-box-containing protein
MTALPAVNEVRVLVIDDNPAIHQDFRKIFEAHSARAAPTAAEIALFGNADVDSNAPRFRIDSALQGQEGLALVRQAGQEGNPYAVAFVDVRMPPGWDGIETTAQLWEADPDLQVVICTAYSDYSWSEMLAKLGRSDRLVILKKPFDTIEVMQLASALAEKWRLARESRSILHGLERRVEERTLELAKASDRLRESETQYRLLFEGNPHPMWVYDVKTLRFVLVNAATVATYGYSREELLGMTIRDLRRGEDLAALDAVLARGRGEGMKSYEWRHRKKDGTLIDVEVSTDRVIFNGGAACLVLAHDVTQRKQAAARIRRLNRVYAVLSGINTLIVRVRDRDELFREACRIAVENGGFRMSTIFLAGSDGTTVVPCAASGVDEDLLVDITEVFQSPERAATTMVALAMREGRPVVANDSLQDPRVVFGAKYAGAGVRSMAVLPLVVGGVSRGALGLYATEVGFFDAEEMALLEELAGDIAFAIDHIEKQELLDYLAYYDALTGLANRKLYLERVAQSLLGAVSGGHGLALFLVDVERFKNINDTLGRPAGDLLLKHVARWLSQVAGDAHLVARVDADHFAVMLPQVRAAGNLLHLVEKRCREFLEHPFGIGDTVLRLAIKVGVAVYPQDGVDAETLFRNAEAALKKAKAGGERYLFHTPEMTEGMAGRLTLENQLRRAVDQGEFVLHYQPKLSLASRKLTGAEALIRWNDPATGLVPPGRFIPMLEETGLIHEVGRWALRQGIADYLRGEAAGLPVVRIAVNVSPLQLRHRGFVKEVRELVGVDPRAAGALELEITESLIMEDVRHSIATLEAIRAFGVRISIDDFGTGFSSLSYLARLPVDTLKIDRSFVVDMTSGPQGLALVSTIIGLAHSLKLKVVAEGVETEEQQRLLALLGCDEMQGFLFSKPLPGEEYERRFLLRPATLPHPALARSVE